MSSTLRTFSQVDPTIKFLRLLPSADPSGQVMYVTDASMNAFIAAAGAKAEGVGLNTIVKSDTQPDYSFAATAAAIPNLVRDLGRRVTIVADAPGNAHREVWIQVQGMNGSTTEGVSGDATTDYGCFWIRTFRDADSGAGIVDANIEWARLG